LDLNHDISVSGAALTDFFLAERRVELAGEGHRFFDQFCTGKAAQEITGFKAARMNYFNPIEEIQFAGGIGHKTWILKTIILYMKKLKLILSISLIAYFWLFRRE
jgi:hypothetical protein